MAADIGKGIHPAAQRLGFAGRKHLNGLYTAAEKQRSNDAEFRAHTDALLAEVRASRKQHGTDVISIPVWVRSGPDRCDAIDMLGFDYATISVMVDVDRSNTRAVWIAIVATLSNFPPEAAVFK